MALVVEDGTGLATAESYVSVADFDTYATKFGWTVSQTTAQKEVGLKLATQYLDAKFGLAWIGTRGSRTQALDWPRFGALDQTGWTLTESEVPRELTNACNELAFLSFTNTLFPNVAAGESGKTIDRIKVGEIEVEETFSGDSESSPVWRVAHSILKPILQEKRLLRA